MDADPTWHVDQLVPVTRHGKREQVYWTYSYGPIDDEHTPNGVGGVSVICTETTQRMRVESVLRDSEARLRFLDQLSEHAQEASDAATIMSTTARMLGGHLGVAVCAYADMEADEDEFTIRGDWTATGAKGIQGTYKLEDFGDRD